MDKKICKCTFAQKMVGDGCDVCNPELALEYAHQTIKDLEGEQAEHDAEVGELAALLFEAKKSLDFVDWPNLIERIEKSLSPYHQIDCPECGGSKESIDVDSRAITICPICNKGKVWRKK